MSDKWYINTWQSVAKFLHKFRLPDMSGTKRIKRFYLCHKEGSNTLGVYTGDISINFNGHVEDMGARHMELELCNMGPTLKRWDVLQKDEYKIRELIAPYISNGSSSHNLIDIERNLHYTINGNTQIINLDVLVNQLDSQIRKYVTGIDR